MFFQYLRKQIFQNDQFSSEIQYRVFDCMSQMIDQ